MDINKLKSIVLYVLNKTPDKTLGKHELFKILYFASQKRLVRYGRAMITDFHALQYGPVPLELYNYLKHSDNSAKLSVIVGKNTITTVEKPDVDELSKVDIQCLDESFAENHGLSFNELVSKSHGFAWKKAKFKGFEKNDRNIDIIDIAIEAGAGEKTLEYIYEQIELEKALS